MLRRYAAVCRLNDNASGRQTKYTRVGHPVGAVEEALVRDIANEGFGRTCVLGAEPVDTGGDRGGSNVLGDRSAAPQVGTQPTAEGPEFTLFD